MNVAVTAVSSVSSGGSFRGDNRQKIELRVGEDLCKIWLVSRTGEWSSLSLL